MRTRIPDLLDMVGQLVAASSVSSFDPELDQSNRGVIDLLSGWLEDLGFDIRQVPISDRDDKLNLVAQLGSGAGGLALAGHSDTVPCDPAAWQTDPWHLRVDGDTLYGLGVCDMKAFFAAVVAAAGRLTADALLDPLFIVATADEESGMRGAQALVDDGSLHAAEVLIGEPTTGVPVRAHKGVMAEALRLYGTAGHSSDPAAGDNALDGMAACLHAMIEWRSELASRNRDAFFAVPVPTVNFGRIRGGDSFNRICEACELHLDVRLLPGMKPEQVHDSLRECVAETLRGSALRWELEPLMVAKHPWQSPADAPIVRAAEEVTGAPARAAMFGTEARYFEQLGMQVVLLGPGDIRHAHAVDEQLSATALRRSVDQLEALVRRRCRRC